MPSAGSDGTRTLEVPRRRLPLLFLTVIRKQRNNRQAPAIIQYHLEVSFLFALLFARLLVGCACKRNDRSFEAS
jgi:hypothetical protein